MLSRSASFPFFVVILCVSFLGVPQALGQTLTGQIEGTVQDEQGNVIPGVEVVATHVATNSRYQALSSDQGRFIFPNVRLGSVTVEAAMPGFRTAVVTGVQVEVGLTSNLQITLQVGAPADEITVLLNEKLLALAEFSVGRGFLISQVAASVRPKGAPSIGLHADHNWLPAPFPVHNMLLTGCWVCDEFSKAGGSTLVIPGSNKLHRHPDAKEVEEKPEAIAIEAPAGSVAMWDGNIWHANWPRTTDGQRVVCHITYTRLMMRTVEDYRAHVDDLIAEHGDLMAQLLGQQDFLEGPQGADYSKLIQTFNNAKR